MGTEVATTGAVMRTIRKPEIQTYTGKGVDPFNFDPAVIDIEDIAHALSQQCRFSGHTKEFYSVAQHATLCATVPEESAAVRSIAKTMLMHDAAEAYLLDMPRPLKVGVLGSMIRSAEDRIMRHIADKFSFDWPMGEVEHDIDNRMLFTEKRDLLVQCDWGWNMPPYAHVVKPLSPAKAKVEFLKVFHKLFSH